MTELQKELFSLADEEYADFQARLLPTLKREQIIGVRIPELRKFASKHEIADFLHKLPHVYYDENILHGIYISKINDSKTCICEIERFLPYIDNWAVNDTIKPKCFKKDKANLMDKICQWVNSDREFTCRFAILMLMSYYLDEDFQKEYLEIPLRAKNQEYYVKMMVAWFYATALAKHYEEILPYIKNNRLDVWTHNKTIQKAVESFRISDKQKKYLKSLKRKEN